MYKDGTRSSTIRELPFTSASNKEVDSIVLTWATTTSGGSTEFSNIIISTNANTQSLECKHHKKVILLDEPLRGIQESITDLIAKSDRKVITKRLCKEYAIKGTETIDDSTNLGTVTRGRVQIVDMDLSLQTCLIGKLPHIPHSSGVNSYTLDKEHYYISPTSGLYIFVDNSKLESPDVNGLKQWLQSNNIPIIYPLKTPVYEEIKSINNEFPTYAEVTHISTDTVIPCNQKIKNTGIECMLKPSTLYSIHDVRNGSGTAKYNLGGTVNTSNKVTTGATLTDNYLRLYGKGLTSKDVEVFEGDTLQTPYFTGMLSAFEDKKITQEMVDSGLEKAENLGKYRVGIKVVGKNKCDNTKNKLATIDLNTGAEIKQNDCVVSDFILVYRDYSSSKIDKENKFVSLTYRYYDVNKKYLGSVKPNFYPHYVRLRALRKSEGINISLEDIKFQLEEGTQVTQYEDYKEYKTSILLDNPPLKGNEICVQNGQLGVLHKRQSIIYNGDEDWKLYNEVGNQTSVFYLNFPSNGVAKPVLCDLFSFYQQAWDKTHNREGITFDTGSNCCYVQIYNSKLETKDEAGFKKWLQKNHCKVVYEVLEPHFEPITPQLPRWVLDIFDNSTISIDTIIPVESKLTYTSYIPSIPAMQETNKNQDELINVSLCATDEMYMMLEPLLQSVPQTLQINERMMSKMVDLYVAMVMRGLKTIDEVPLRYREEVKKILEQLEK